jgi:hypothetical protein
VILSDQQRSAFQRDGLLLLPGFYDVEKEILPILRHAHQIIQLCLRANQLEKLCSDFSIENFDSGLNVLLQKNRALGGVVYDAVKQIPAFMRLLSSEKHEQVMQSLRGTDLCGVVDRGYGIRIDHPGEMDFLSGWHQDYHGHLRSLDGINFWSPLRKVFLELGPVEFCPQSHTNGVFAQVCPPENKHAKNTTQYCTGLRIVDEAKVIAKYDKVKPLLDLGDAVVIDFLTVHRSTQNLSEQSRWSMQLRWFNFRDELGVKHHWPKSYAHGKSFADIHPELLTDPQN